MSKLQFFLILLCGVVFAFIGGIISDGIMSASSTKADTSQQENELDIQTEADNGNDITAYLVKEGLIIGIVEKRCLRVYAPQSIVPNLVRLTGMQMQEARPPESAEIDLSSFEGKAILVSGHYGGGWIYAAVIVDSGGPLLTILVKHTFKAR